MIRATKATWKATCPMIMVGIPSSNIPVRLRNAPKAITSATAKMMSGVTTGRFRRPSRAPPVRLPHGSRWMPMASSVPSTVEIAVEARASSNVLAAALRMSSSWKSLAYHESVNPPHESPMREAFTEKAITHRSGR